jgi:FAD-dependent urate hydroxylase
MVIIGAGPYGMSAAAYLRGSGVDARIFGRPMAFWSSHMPAGMCLRSNWDASHIADPNRSFTLDAFQKANGNHIGKPIELHRFVSYGLWYQKCAVPDVDTRHVRNVERRNGGFRVILDDGEQVDCRRVVVATGIGSFSYRPAQFKGLSGGLVSHSIEETDLSRFAGKKVAVVGGGQSALESAVLLKESGAEPEVLVRNPVLNWVGRHARLHHLGLLSRLLYSDRDVGPAGISRLVAMPHLFRRFPRKFQDRVAYRAIRPAGASWLLPRLKGVKITLDRKIVNACEKGSRLEIKLHDGTERIVDHCLLATGFRVDLGRYPFLSPDLLKQVETAGGYPVLRRGLESSVPGLHFLGKPASWSFGPLLCFVSGTEFAATELVRFVTQCNDTVIKS